MDGHIHMHRQTTWKHKSLTHKSYKKMFNLILLRWKVLWITKGYYIKKLRFRMKKNLQVFAGWAEGCPPRIILTRGGQRLVGVFLKYEQHNQWAVMYWRGIGHHFIFYSRISNCWCNLKVYISNIFGQSHQEVLWVPLVQLPISIYPLNCMNNHKSLRSCP